MKNLGMISLPLAAAALAISLYTMLMVRDIFPTVAAEPRTAILKFLKGPFWDGTNEFFAKHRSELVSHVEISNFLENNGVGIAFVRTTGGNKKLQFCLWMRKTASGWENVSHLGARLAGEPRRQRWITENENWLKEMELKIDDWEKASDSIW